MADGDRPCGEAAIDRPTWPPSYCRAYTALSDVCVNHSSTYIRYIAHTNRLLLTSVLPSTHTIFHR